MVRGENATLSFDSRRFVEENSSCAVKRLIDTSGTETYAKVYEGSILKVLSKLDIDS